MAKRAAPKARAKRAAPKAPGRRRQRRTLQDGNGLLDDPKERARTFGKRALGILSKLGQVGGQTGAEVVAAISFDSGLPDRDKQFVFFASEGQDLDWFSQAQALRRKMLAGRTRIQGMYLRDWDAVFGGGGQQQWKAVNALNSSALTHPSGVTEFEARPNLRDEYARQAGKPTGEARALPSPEGASAVELMVVPEDGSAQQQRPGPYHASTDGRDADDEEESDEEEEESEDESDAEPVLSRDVGWRLYDRAVEWARAGASSVAPSRYAPGRRLFRRALAYAGAGREAE